MKAMTIRWSSCVDRRSAGIRGRTNDAQTPRCRPRQMPGASRSGSTWTGPLASYLQISMSSSLSGRLKENQLRAASAGVASDLFQTKHLLVKVNGLFQVRDAVTRVIQFLNHRSNLNAKAASCLKPKVFDFRQLPHDGDQMPAGIGSAMIGQASTWRSSATITWSRPRRESKSICHCRDKSSMLSSEAGPTR